MSKGKSIAMSDMALLQEHIGAWGRQHWPETPALSVFLEHLADEMEELWEETETIDTNVTLIGEEAADIVLLLLHMAARYGFDLEEAVRRKWEEVREREWGEPDARGVRHHVG